MKKRLIAALITVMTTLLLFGTTALAEQTHMYVNNTYVTREFSTVGQFDMIPILDIAGELGYSCSVNGQNFQVSNGITTFYFKMGSASVYAQDGVWFGLDVVPKIINGRIMIPANFLIYNMGVSYTWDEPTKTLFINSDSTYKWLINTPEYKNERIRRENAVSKVPKGTMSNPFSATDGAEITFQKWTGDPKKQVAIECVYAVRGAEANRIAEYENMFNEKPNSSQEWCFFEFNIRYISCSGNGGKSLKASDLIFTNTFFSSSGSRVNIANTAALSKRCKGDGIFDTELYPGSSGKAIIGILIPKNVDSILLRVPNKSQNTNTWIKCI